MVELPPSPDVRPDPDPTRLTTANLLREIEHLDRLLNQRIDQLEKAFDARLTRETAAFREVIADQVALRNAIIKAGDKAIGKAEIANEKRFEAIAQQIGRVTDLTRGLIPRAEGNAVHKALDEKLDGQIARTAERFADVHHTIDLAGGGEIAAKQASQKAFAIWAAVVAGVGIVIGIVSLAVVIIR